MSLWPKKKGKPEDSKKLAAEKEKKAKENRISVLLKEVEKLNTDANEKIAKLKSEKTEEIAKIKDDTAKEVSKRRQEILKLKDKGRGLK